MTPLYWATFTTAKANAMANPAPGFAKHPDHTIRLSAADQTLRVNLGGEQIAASERAVRLDEAHYPPRYYLPAEDVDMSKLSATEHASHCPFKGDARYWTINAGGQQVVNGAWAYDQPFDECRAIQGYIAFYGEELEFSSELNKAD